MILMCLPLALPSPSMYVAEVERKEDEVIAQRIQLRLLCRIICFTLIRINVMSLQIAATGTQYSHPHQPIGHVEQLQ